MIGTVMLAWTLTVNNAGFQNKTQHMEFVGQATQNALWVPTQIIVSAPSAPNTVASNACVFNFSIQNMSNSGSKNPSNPYYQDVIYNGELQSDQDPLGKNKPIFGDLSNYFIPVYTYYFNPLGNYGVTSSQDLTYSVSNPPRALHSCNPTYPIKVDVLAYPVYPSNS